MRVNTVTGNAETKLEETSFSSTVPRISQISSHSERTIMRKEKNNEKSEAEGTFPLGDTCLLATELSVAGKYSWGGGGVRCTSLVENVLKKGGF